MDYEKKYRDILNLAKSYKGNDLEEFLDLAFPEHKESEDERIRKGILALVKKHAVNHERCQMEAYLEKLKNCYIVPKSHLDPVGDKGEEGKPVGWSEEDKRHLDRIQMVLESWDRSHTSLAGLPSTIPDDIDWLKSLYERFNLPPKQKWSEEDEKYLNLAINIITSDFGEDSPIVSSLKSLRFQLKLEWSEEPVSTKDAIKFGNLEYERGVKDGIQIEKSRH